MGKCPTCFIVSGLSITSLYLKNRVQKLHAKCRLHDPLLDGICIFFDIGVCVHSHRWFNFSTMTTHQYFHCSLMHCSIIWVCQQIPTPRNLQEMGFIEGGQGWRFTREPSNYQMLISQGSGPVIIPYWRGRYPPLFLCINHLLGNARIRQDLGN